MRPLKGRRGEGQGGRPQRAEAAAGGGGGGRGRGPAPTQPLPLSPLLAPPRGGGEGRGRQRPGVVAQLGREAGRGPPRRRRRLPTGRLPGRAAREAQDPAGEEEDGGRGQGSHEEGWRGGSGEEVGVGVLRSQEEEEEGTGGAAPQAVDDSHWVRAVRDARGAVSWPGKVCAGRSWQGAAGSARAKFPK